MTRLAAWSDARSAQHIHRCLPPGILVIRAIAVILGFVAAGPASGKTLFLVHYNDSRVDASYAAGDATAAPIAYSEQHGECGLCNRVHNGYQLALTTESGRFGHGLDLTKVSHNTTYPAGACSRWTGGLFGTPGR